MKKKIKLELSQETKNVGGKNAHKSSMPTFKCSCGDQILVVPDLAAMNKAIKNHIRQHKGVKEQFLTEETVKAVSLHETQ
ncbi:MAG: hypothetical protein NWF05_10790 [Candidatus Bathyarchaeota archaeon]|nr:hypothetical protein [Candidatus Bathyarchaeota archaeon]